MIILDTNVVSELMKPKPAESVVDWISGQSAISLFVTTVTQAEVLYGLALLPASQRRDHLEDAIQAIFEEDFAGRILLFDQAAAYLYAVIAAERRQSGQPISQFDGQIAAIARSRGGIVATRNVSDFLGCGVDLADPWEK